jgi:hypothetical protein
MASKLDEIFGKRTLKEMLELEEPDKDKVLDVVVPDIKEEKGLERIAEKGYKPKSVDVLKETGNDVVNVGKEIGKIIYGFSIFSIYFLATNVTFNLTPYTIPYAFSKRKNTALKNFYGDVTKTSDLQNAGLTLGGFVGALGTFAHLGYLYGYEAVYNKNYWLLSIPVVTNVASFLYERIQVNRTKLASKTKSLEGAVEKND